MTTDFPIESPDPVKLSASDLIGTGTRRLCYCFPGRAQLCIKIPKDKKNGILQQKREIRYYRKLEKRGVPTDRITRFHGILPTSLGTGYVYDAIRDDDGRISRQMNDYLCNDPDAYPEYLRALRVLEDYLFDNRVIIYDLSPYNILCRRSADGSLDPYIIDGVGDVVAIPVLNLSRRLVLRKIRRRWMRMIDKLAARYAWMSAYRFEH